MSIFTRTDAQRTLVALVGTALLSTTCVLGAVGPAKASDRIESPSNAVGGSSKADGRTIRPILM